MTKNVLECSYNTTPRTAVLLNYVTYLCILTQSPVLGSIKRYVTQAKSKQKLYVCKWGHLGGQRNRDWCITYDFFNISVCLIVLFIKNRLLGCPHRLVDSSTPSILPPKVRVLSTQFMFLSCIVNLCYIWMCIVERNKINKKRPGLALFNMPHPHPISFCIL